MKSDENLELNVSHRFRPPGMKVQNLNRKCVQKKIKQQHNNNSVLNTFLIVVLYVFAYI